MWLPPIRPIRRRTQLELIVLSFRVWARIVWRLEPPIKIAALIVVLLLVLAVA
jgi:hypothetical protein